MSRIDWKRVLFVALLGTIAVLVFATGSVFAQSVTVTSKVKAIYLGAQGAEFYPDAPVLQSDVFVSWKNGMYFDLWTSTAANTTLRFDKEVDFTLGRRVVVGRMKYSADMNYYAIQAVDVLNPNVEVSLNATKLSPFARLEVYAPRKRGGPKKGVMEILGLRSATKVAPRLGLQVEAKVRHDSGAFGFDEAWLGQGYVGAVIYVGKSTVVGGVRMSDPMTSVSAKDGRKGEAVWEIGISRGF